MVTETHRPGSHSARIAESYAAAAQASRSATIRIAIASRRWIACAERDSETRAPICAPTITPRERQSVLRRPCPWAKLPLSTCVAVPTKETITSTNCEVAVAIAAGKPSADHQRNLEDAAADAEKARENANQGAEDGSLGKANAVHVASATSVDELAWRSDPSRVRRDNAASRAQKQPHSDGEEHDREDRIERPAWNCADKEDADDRTGNAGQAEHESAAIVDPPLVSVCERSRDGVDEDDCQADRGDRLGGLVRVENQQDRREQKAAAHSDERPEGADRDAEQHEEDRDGRRERRTHAPKIPLRSGRPVTRLRADVYTGIRSN